MATSLGIMDYSILAIMLILSACVGLYFRFTGGKQKSTHEFFMANKDMAVFPVICSLMASFESATGLLGMPVEIYLYGTQLVLMIFVLPVAALVTAYVFLPVLYNLKVKTSYEYIERRFGKHLRYITSLIFIIQNIFYMGVSFYAPCVALEATTGLSAWSSIAILSTICTFYCFLGGLKAVIWTDVFQSGLMFAAYITIAVIGTIYVGGIGTSFRIAQSGDRLQLFNFSFDLEERYTFWNILVFTLTAQMSRYSCNQTEIQRLQTLSTLSRAKRALHLSTLCVIFHHGLLAYISIVIYAMFSDCDPMYNPTNGLKSSNEIVPYAIVTLFSSYIGLSGLCIAGLFSAALSSVSSAINSLANVTLEDFIRPLCYKKDFSETWATFVSKLLALGYGILCLLISLIVGKLRGLLEANIVLTGMISGPAFGVFSLGMLTTRANEKGALIGLLFGLLLTGWISCGSLISKLQIPEKSRSITGCPEVRNDTIFNNTTLSFITTETHSLGRNYTEQTNDVFSLYRISFRWFSFIGFLAVVIVGYICSVIIDYFKDEQKAISPNLISPVLQKWYFPSKKEVQQTIEVFNIYKPKKDDN